ncbi:MAG: hypothetical protein P8L31_12670 [Pseudomonadales bacterium]|nr:hypothetical protein [Pseudomonadales bacterium]
MGPNLRRENFFASPTGVECWHYKYHLFEGWFDLTASDACTQCGQAKNRRVDGGSEARTSGEEKQCPCLSIVPRTDYTKISRHSLDFRRGRGKPKSHSEKAGNLAGNILAALEQGMHPVEVGERVTHAVKQKKLLLTHPSALEQDRAKNG